MSGRGAGAPQCEQEETAKGREALNFKPLVPEEPHRGIKPRFRGRERVAKYGNTRAKVSETPLRSRTNDTRTEDGMHFL